jgi:hypothetical protein
LARIISFNDGTPSQLETTFDRSHDPRKRNKRRIHNHHLDISMIVIKDTVQYSLKLALCSHAFNALAVNPSFGICSNQLANIRNGLLNRPGRAFSNSIIR